jgi:hypothetical protein
VLGNLATVDSRRRIDRILNKYLAPIPGPVMITAANVIGNASKIAAAKPALADRIAAAILQVENAQYQTDECRNVATGHAIESLGRFFQHIGDKRPVFDFVARQCDNRRNATRKKAQAFLKKHAAAPMGHC